MLMLLALSLHSAVNPATSLRSAPPVVPAVLPLLEAVLVTSVDSPAVSITLNNQSAFVCLYF